MGKIATEQEAYNVGKSGAPQNNKCCTKKRAEDLGCNIKGTYSSNQLVQYSDLYKETVSSYVGFSVYFELFEWELNGAYPRFRMHCTAENGSGVVTPQSYGWFEFTVYIVDANKVGFDSLNTCYFGNFYSKGYYDQYNKYIIIDDYDYDNDSGIVIDDHNTPSSGPIGTTGSDYPYFAPQRTNLEESLGFPQIDLRIHINLKSSELNNAMHKDVYFSNTAGLTNLYKSIEFTYALVD